MSAGKLEEYLSQKDAQLRVFALTIVGIALNSVLAIPAYQAVFTFLFGSTLGESTILIGFFFLTMTITPIYCLAASISFSPKRLINPLYIQTATVGILTVFIAVANAQQFMSLQRFYEFLSGIIGTFLIAILFLF